MSLQVRNVRIEYPRRLLLTDVDFEVQAAECVALVGPSGSGKTSLLNAACGIARPRFGEVIVGGRNLGDLSSGERAKFRLTNVGIVFQFGELLPELTAIENIALQLRLAGTDKTTAEERAIDALERVGLGDRGTEHPDSLSGGEQQRVGIARAVVHGPALIVADEPTGMLDRHTTESVMRELLDRSREAQAALLIATHDRAVAEQADRVFEITEQSVQPIAHAGA